jgi:hypothetical protein
MIFENIDKYKVMLCFAAADVGIWSCRTEKDVTGSSKEMMMMNQSDLNTSYNY